MNTRNLRFRSNRVRDILGLFHEELDTMYGSGEVAVFCEMLFEAYLGWDKVRLLTSKEHTVDQSDLLRFHWALEDLLRQRPIQHIIGHTDFCGCRIEVNPDVLIPRPETEEMVEWLLSGPSDVRSLFSTCSVLVQSITEQVLNKYRTNTEQRSQLLDLCTGSGCIAIALKRALPQAEVTAVEVSEKALAVARRNAENNGVEVNFLQGDLLDPQFSIPDSQFSIIVSNPPYVRESERAEMRRNVIDYDPALALFVPDDDPLRFYRAIAAIARKHLAEGGLVAVEINEAFAGEVCTLFHEQGFCPAVHNDFRGKARWVTAN